MAYRLIVESALDYAIFALDPDGYVRSWNRGAQRIKGYRAEEIIGQHFSVFYPPEPLARGWPQYELRMARETGRFEDEGWRVRRDGTRFWANIIITRLCDADGRLVGFSKITRDLTERRRQETLLRESEERFRLLVDGVKDYAIFMLDPTGVIASWNAGARTNTGYEAEEVIGRHFSMFYPPDVAASGWPMQELVAALRDGRFEDEGWRVRKDGSRYWASVIITALHHENGEHRGFAKVTRDLTDQRRIAALQEESRRITTFLAMLGHELRNPLAPIASAIALLQHEPPPPGPARDAQDIIDRQSRLLARLVDDLLDVGRITSGKIRLERAPLRLADAVRDALEAIRPLIRERGHALHVALDDGLWVDGDRVRLVQVAANLLHNAARFTPDGGNIRVSLVAHGEDVELRVADDGIGIPAALRPQIFQLFVQGQQTAERAQGGLGLGLSLVHQLVTLHGGAVSVYSAGRSGHGSEFIVRLPTVAPSTTSPDRDAPELPMSDTRILVVDDNRDAANTLAMLFETMGHLVHTAYDGPGALQAVERHAPDVVFLDIGLPGLSGLDVARRIHETHANPPKLVAITGYGQDSDREESRAAGFDAHLVKPVDPDKLQGVLDGLAAPGVAR